MKYTVKIVDLIEYETVVDAENEDDAVALAFDERRENRPEPSWSYIGAKEMEETK